MIKKLLSINEQNCIKLEIISKLLDKTQSQLVDEILDKNLIIDSILCQQKIAEIQKVIAEQQKALLS